MTLSSSELYCAAAGVDPVGAPLAAASTCRMCGVALAAGSLAVEATPALFGAGFNNSRDLRAPFAPHVCGACMALWAKEWLQRKSKSFACSAGVFPLNSNENVAAFVLRPPEPPFVAVYSTRQQQHMIWRTPISGATESFVVRVDDELLTVRRSAVLDGLAAYREIEGLMRTEKLRGKRLNPPAALMSNALMAPNMGLLREDVVELMGQLGRADLVARLHRLGVGEWWALNAVRHFDPDAPPAWGAYAEKPGAGAGAEAS